MKSAIVYIGLFVGTFVAAALIVFAVYKVKPALFIGSPKSNQQIAAVAQAVDSTASHDSTRAVQTKAPDSTVTITPLSNVALLQDSIKSLISLLALENEKAKQLENAKKALPQPDSKDAAKPSDTKMMAKMLDGIKSEQAVKIINNLSDKEVKEILPLLNKRQAGKILSALEPSRAAKLIR